MPNAKAVLLCIGLASAGFGTAALSQPTPDLTGIVSTRAAATRVLPNTVADVSVAVEVHARDVPAASAVLSTRIRTLLGFLGSQRAERLRTVSVDIAPDVQEVRNQPDRITGYTGHAAVSFRTTPELIGDVLAGCLNNGANSIGGIEFAPREAEVEAARREMAVEATRTAMADARAVVEATGEHIVRVQSVQVGSPEAPQIAIPSPAPMRAAMVMRKTVAPIPMLAGDATVAVSVAVAVRTAP